MNRSIFTLENINRLVKPLADKYRVKEIYLFGSYAKGTAKETSDVDLLISMPVDGLKYYELLELLREKLKKKVDLLDVAQLNDNPALVQVILKEGIKIYRTIRQNTLIL